MKRHHEENEQSEPSKQDGSLMNKTSNKLGMFIEPYYGGSHKALIDLLKKDFEENGILKELHLCTQTPKKFQWKVRVSSLTISQTLPSGGAYDVLIVSSMLNLSELLALRTDWSLVKLKVVYMHENQLEYPKQDKNNNNATEQRDYFFSHAQITSLLVADRVLWNSTFNLTSFLARIPSLFSKIPLKSEERPNAALVVEAIKKKSIVCYFPISIPASLRSELRRAKEEEAVGRVGFPFQIAFPHRLEHDKNPLAFLRVCKRLIATPNKRRDFEISFFSGEEFLPSEMHQCLEEFKSRIKHLGRVDDWETYLRKLSQCDVAVSTSNHEFFGVAMMEAAVICELDVLLPNRLCYPELFQRKSLFESEDELYEKLLRMINGEYTTKNEPNSGVINVELFDNEINFNTPSVKQKFRTVFTSASVASSC